MYFNSRPHKEVDCVSVCNSKNALIFQLTTSQGGRRFAILTALLRLWHFNSRPHKEVDALQQVRKAGTYRYFNSRPHKEVDEPRCNWLVLGYAFQLTTSQGGRRQADNAQVCPRKYFNSRPHKEVDDLLPHAYRTVCVFQLTTSQGGRRQTLVFYAVRNIQFQLTTSQGGRPEGIGKLPIKHYIFQLTTSQGGRPYPASELRGRNSFQLTTSQGGRPWGAGWISGNPIYFNSRPHKEVDPTMLRS